MDQVGSPRKRVRHFHEPGHCHELTFSCYRRQALLTNDRWRALLSESIDRANERHGYRLIAFVTMPEHVHLLVYPTADASGIDQLLRAIKRPFSFRIKQLLLASQSPLMEKLTIRQRPGVQTFRFWQEGPGYDRNLTHPKTVMTSIDYLHENPVRRGLCRRAIDWPWSSARHFHSGTQATPVPDPRLPRIEPLPAEYLDQRGD